MKKLSMMFKKTGLALEGGGGKGAYQIGSYIALQELGYKFDMVAGTSIGSLNAAIIAQGDIELAKEIWLNIDSELIGMNKDLVKLSKNFKINKDTIKTSFNEIIKIIQNKGLDTTKYKEMVTKYIDENKIRKSKMNYGLVTLRIKDLKPLELTIDEIEEGKLVDYILASSYFPLFKMDKIIDNSYYIDGGLTNNLPITLLEKNNCKKIVAVKIDGIGFNKKQTYEHTEIETISPTKETGPILMFDKEDIKNNFKMGYLDTLLYFKKLLGYKYYFKKFSFTKIILRNVNKKTLDLIKIIYKTDNLRIALIKSIEEILEDNNVDYYKVYKIKDIIKYIKENNLKSNNPIINELFEEI